jgi:hypothetical protein
VLVNALADRWLIMVGRPGETSRAMAEVGVKNLYFVMFRPKVSYQGPSSDKCLFYDKETARMAKGTETPGTTDVVDSPSNAAAPGATESLSANLPKMIDMQGMATEIAGLGMALAAEEVPSVTASPAEITDELEKGGPAIGSFLKAVGMAVAETQSALDASLVKTAQELSKTNIRTVAVFEQNLDADGNMTKGNPIIQELPLINYLMPTAYAFSQVHLTADMEVSEFNATNGLNIKKSSFSAGVSAKANYGLGGFGASGSMHVGYSNDSLNVNTSQAQDRAAGKLHMEATLEPRTDIQLPRPFIIQRGPRLRLMVTEIKDLTDTPQGTDPPKVVGREATIQAILTDDGGQPLGGKTLQVNCDQPTLNYTASGTTGGQGSENGKVSIKVSRQGPNYDPKASITGNIRVWMNLVTATTPVTL